MPATPLWDIFCTVIDNHGDLGVCWRLATQLQSAGQRVRLWVDDASALTWMAPLAHSSPTIVVLPWDAATQPTQERAHVWIEAFGCTLPDAFVAQGVAQTAHAPPPLWINLEYLSAESWVPRMHGLPSPVMSGPAKGWSKTFIYPGFTPDTGGLLRENNLIEQMQAFDRDNWRSNYLPTVDPTTSWVSLFCYESPALPDVLRQLAHHGYRLLALPGRPQQTLQHALQHVSIPPAWNALDYTDQTGFDHMLWACDLNFVRGEDSLVRALWAAKAFVWHIYPQTDNAHHAKLHAFLDWLDAPPSLRRFHNIWNGLETGPLPDLSPATLQQWARTTQAARQRLLTQASLCDTLLDLAHMHQQHHPQHGGQRGQRT